MHINYGALNNFDFIMGGFITSMLKVLGWVNYMLKVLIIYFSYQTNNVFSIHFIHLLFHVCLQWVKVPLQGYTFTFPGLSSMG